MNKEIELLAPGGDIEAIKAAIAAGADAIYCGLNVFNARNRAANLTIDELSGAIHLAHKHNCKIFLTLNILIVEYEIPILVRLLNKIVNINVDGIIVQDLGLFNIIKKHFSTLEVHASTQITTHNEGQIQFLKKIGTTRVNLARELNFSEIKKLSTFAHKNDIKIEVFVHGALCVSFSGQCYFSSVYSGNSANRGRCSQPCRGEYQQTKAGSKYPLNLKDNSAYFNLTELVDANVDSYKIEGRIKSGHYVYTVVDTWRQQIDSYIKNNTLINDDSNLHKVFNRSFTNSFLTGKISKSMFIEGARDHSLNYAKQKSGATSEKEIKNVGDNLHQEKNKIGAILESKIKGMSTSKKKLQIKIKAKLNEPLIITAITTDTIFEEKSKSNLTKASKSSITKELLKSRFKEINRETYTQDPLDFELFNEQLFIPFKELKSIKKKLSYLLNGKKELHLPVELPQITSNLEEKISPQISILISEKEDIQLCSITDAEIYFKLPESLKEGSTEYYDFFTHNPKIVPYFPAILIGQDYIEAVKLLKDLRPQKIVTNNTGIAYKAFEMNIEWIAGPYLNSINSYALMTLKEELNCSGAFISNEINKNQIRKIKRPPNFKLLYSIYHPILMMTSRQCFFQKTIGCNKEEFNQNCIEKCERRTTITNTKEDTFIINKNKGGYSCIYNKKQYLNIDIIKDLPNFFDNYFIDLTNIVSEIKLDKTLLIDEFEKILKSKKQSSRVLDKLLINSTNQQYIKGL